MHEEEEEAAIDAALAPTSLKARIEALQHEAEHGDLGAVIDQLIGRKDLWVMAICLLLATVAGFLGWLPKAHDIQSSLADYKLIVVLFGSLIIATCSSIGIPISLPAIATGLLLPAIPAILVCWVGFLLAAAIQYTIGARRDLETSDQMRTRIQTASSSLVSVVLLRIPPPIPFAPLNYIAGAIGVRRAVWIWGSAIGSLPRIGMYIILGGTLDHLSLGNIALTALACLGLLLLSYIVQRLLGKLKTQS